MRSVRVVASVLFVACVGACGKKAEPITTTDPIPVTPGPNADPPEPKPEEPVLGPLMWRTLVDDYRDNVIAADKKYLGRKVAVKAASHVIGKNKSGAAYVGLRYSDSPTAEPSIIFVFSKAGEEDVAKLKANASITITGTCRGRVDDGIARFPKGYEFHVLLEECRVSDFTNWATKKP